MTITIYGTGCPTCKTLFELTKLAVKELQLSVEVQYVPDIQKMIEIGLMQSPAIVIDDYVAHAGSALGIEDIKKVLTENSTVNTTPATKGCSCGGKC